MFLRAHVGRINQPRLPFGERIEPFSSTSLNEQEDNLSEGKLTKKEEKLRRAELIEQFNKKEYIYSKEEALKMLDDLYPGSEQLTPDVMVMQRKFITFQNLRSI